MACSQLDGVGRACKVGCVFGLLLGAHAFFQFVQLILCKLLQLVDFHAHHLLLVGSHITEVGHQGGNLTLFAEIFQAQLLNFVGILCREIAHFVQQLVYFIEYHLFIVLLQFGCKVNIFILK